MKKIKLSQRAKHAIMIGGLCSENAKKAAKDKAKREKAKAEAEAKAE